MKEQDSVVEAMRKSLTDLSECFLSKVELNELRSVGVSLDAVVARATSRRWLDVTRSRALNYLATTRRELAEELAQDEKSANPIACAWIRSGVRETMRACVKKAEEELAASTAEFINFLNSLPKAPGCQKTFAAVLFRCISDEWWALDLKKQERGIGYRFSTLDDAVAAFDVRIARSSGDDWIAEPNWVPNFIAELPKSAAHWAFGQARYGVAVVEYMTGDGKIMMADAREAVSEDGNRKHFSWFQDNDAERQRIRLAHSDGVWVEKLDA